MKRRMDALYMESFRQEDAPADGEPEEGLSWQPMVDVVETEEAWVLIADLPGVPEGDVELELKDDHLTIRGKRVALASSAANGILKRERPGGSFSRSFVIPADARKDDIAGELKLGVLTVTIPKGRPERAVHKVSVSVE